MIPYNSKSKYRLSMRKLYGEADDLDAVFEIEDEQPSDEFLE